MAIRSQTQSSPWRRSITILSRVSSARALKNGINDFTRISHICSCAYTDTLKTKKPLVNLILWEVILDQILSHVVMSPLMSPFPIQALMDIGPLPAPRGSRRKSETYSRSNPLHWLRKVHIPRRKCKRKSRRSGPAPERKHIRGPATNP